MQAFVPKHRRPRFELKLNIIDLNNIPLVCGTAYVKWHLSSSTAAEHRGQTERAVIQDHLAIWDYEKVIPVRLTIDRNQMLQDCMITFEIIQEFSSNNRGDRIALGNVKLNLAEYADKSDNEHGIVRRYLMQDSKVNSTLKIGIYMRQLDGEKTFITPPLKSAMAFGGIAGILQTDTAQPPDDLGDIPSINIGRETGDMKDLYRRTLATSWTCRDGELPPDQLIEDIFQGGNGFPPGVAPSSSSRSDRTDDYSLYHDESSISDSASRSTLHGGSSRLSPKPERQRLGKGTSRSHHDRVESSSGSTLGAAYGEGNSSPGDWRRSRNPREVSEFDARPDLKTWTITVRD